MKIIGIIAEYNPFHNGHAYQIKKIKEELGADYVVIAMSGNFVQRGTPAIIDKYTRTKMALSCGADLVFELPVLWATASAEFFATAGVTLFDKLGCVDNICFGAETDHLKLLSEIADILASEPETYRTFLATYLKEGFPFPIARSKAFCSYLQQASVSNSISIEENNPDSISSILSTPNNILAIEYLKALKRRNSKIIPLVIKREGAGYHDEEIANAHTHPMISNASSPVPTASATAIRKTLQTAAHGTDLQSSKTLKTAMPDYAIDILNDYLSKNALIYSNDLSSILGYRLLTSNVSSIADIGDSNSDIANRIYKNRMHISSFEQFCEYNKSKDITYSRISRILLHLILDITNQDYLLGKTLDYAPYLRILGFRMNATTLLKIIKQTSQIPLISKLANAPSLLTEDAMTILKKDIFAADLYAQICALKNGSAPSSEYTQNIVRI